ncbi:MAG TPA: serine/threonine protein kinase [Methylothermaceae bacterium]|nr:serine/threonine protein kinase [Methylothermaceae bacterium]
MAASPLPDRPFDHLPTGLVVDRYVIERPLADGGFSAVYLARQLEDMIQVAIKEYLPRRLAYRDWNGNIVPNDEACRNAFLRGRRLFVEEARMLATLKHPNIVEVTGFFHANATVYMVMRYDYGKSLGWYVKHRVRLLDGRFLLRLTHGLLAALEAIHEQGFVHLDLKPENVLIRPDGEPLLLDFGAARPFPHTKAWNRPGKVRTPGFSPPEQFLHHLPLGPWSDFYALAATLRFCLDHKPPPEVPKRLEHDTLKPAAQLYHWRYPENLLTAIDRALNLDPGERPQTVAEFRDLLTTSDCLP